MFSLSVLPHHRRRPGAKLGGTEKNFANQNFLNDLFIGKHFHFHAENFLKPFLVIAYNVYMALSLREKHLFLKNNSLIAHFFKTQFVLSRDVNPCPCPCP